jgi:rhodanese-related sulfurtransferase
MIALDPLSALLQRTARAVVDVRDEPDFRDGHLPGSGNLPLRELEGRRAELPPRDAPVLVVADDGGRARAGAGELVRLGYSDVAWLDAPLAACPGAGEGRGPGARLWRPARFLEEILPHLPRGRVLDVAAGSGREAVHLALLGFEVEAWDRAPEALERARGLARSHGASLRTVVCDFERRDATLPAAGFDVVMCFRFLQRSLFPAMAAALRPGGHLVYETYLVGQERFGRPTHARFLLRPGELRGAFPGLRVERYEECAPAEGPITARLWAIRPGIPAGADPAPAP